MSSSDAMSINNQQKEILKESGRELIVIPDKIYRKIHYAVPTFENAMKDYQDLYSYNFVDFEDLTPMEKETFGLSRKIIDFLQRNNFRSKTKIKISETISIKSDGTITLGEYKEDENEIIILRKVLRNKTEFCGVLLHEFADSQNGYLDNTRDFEDDLTNMLGSLFIDFVKSERNRH